MIKKNIIKKIQDQKYDKTTIRVSKNTKNIKKNMIRINV